MQEVAAGFLGRVATVSFGCDCFVALPLQKDCMPASFCFCTMDLRSNYWHHQQHVPLYHTKFKFHRLPQRRITRPALEPRHSASNMSTVHLVVLQHGLWGSPADVANLTSYLEKALAQQPTHEDEELALLKSAVNAKRLTYDGIDVCGARLAQLVQDTIQQYADGGKKVTKLSMIGVYITFDEFNALAFRIDIFTDRYMHLQLPISCRRSHAAHPLHGALSPARTHHVMHA